MSRNVSRCDSCGSQKCYYIFRKIRSTRTQAYFKKIVTFRIAEDGLGHVPVAKSSNHTTVKPTTRWTERYVGYAMARFLYIKLYPWFVSTIIYMVKCRWTANKGSLVLRKTQVYFFDDDSLSIASFLLALQRSFLKKGVN